MDSSSQYQADVESVIDFLDRESPLSTARVNDEELDAISIPEELEGDGVLFAGDSDGDSSPGSSFGAQDSQRLDHIFASMVDSGDSSDDEAFSRDKDEANTELDRVLHSARSWRNIFHGQEPSAARERLAHALMFGTPLGSDSPSSKADASIPTRPRPVTAGARSSGTGSPLRAPSSRSLVSSVYDTPGPSQVPSIRSSVEFERDAVVKLDPNVRPFPPSVNEGNNGNKPGIPSTRNRRYSDIELQQNPRYLPASDLPGIDEVSVWEGVVDLLDDMSNRYQQRIEKKKTAIVRDAQPLHELKGDVPLSASNRVLAKQQLNRSTASHAAEVLELNDEPAMEDLALGEDDDLIPPRQSEVAWSTVKAGEASLPVVPAIPMDRIELPPDSSLSTSARPTPKATPSVSKRAVSARPATGPANKRLSKLRGDSQSSSSIDRKKKKERAGTAGSKRGSRNIKSASVSSPRRGSKKKTIRRNGTSSRNAFATCLKTVPAEIRCVASCGKDVWCGERHGCVTVRNILNGEVIDEIEIGNYHAWCLLVTDGAVWIGTEYGPLLVYGSRSRALLKEIPRAHGGGIHSMISGMGRVWTASNDFSMHEWDVKTFQRIRTYRGHSNGVKCVTLVGPMLWSGSDDQTVRVWSIGGGTSEALSVLKGHTGGVQALLSTSKYVWSASDDGTVRMWDVLELTCFKTINLNMGSGTPNCLISMGGHIWCSGSDKNIHVISISTGEITRKMPDHVSYISSMARVKQLETRIVWTWSLNDGALHVWKRDKVNDTDLAEQLADVLNSNRLLRAQTAALSEDLQEARDSHMASVAHAEAERLVLLQHIEELGVKVSVQSQESARLRAKTESDRASADRDGTELAALQRENEDLRDHQMELERSLQQSRNSAAQRSEEWTADRMKLMSELEALRAANIHLEDEKNAEVAQLRREHESEVGPMREKVEQLEQKLAKTASDLVAVEKGKFKLEEQHTEATNTIASLKEELTVASRVIVNTQSKHELAEAEHDSLMTDFELQKVELDALKEKSEEMEKVLRNREVAEIEMRFDHVARSLKDLDQHLAKARSLMSSAIAGPNVKSLPSQQREAIVQPYRDLQSVFASAKELCRSIMAECLTGPQRLHIGIGNPGRPPGHSF